PPCKARQPPDDVEYSSARPGHAAAPADGPATGPAKSQGKGEGKSSAATERPAQAIAGECQCDCYGRGREALSSLSRNRARITRREAASAQGHRGRVGRAAPARVAGFV